MKKISIFLVFFLISVALSSFKGQVLAVGQSEGANPQSNDLCGGTGGNGMIINLGNNTFTLKLNDGSNQIIHLTNQAVIKTLTGPISLSHLQIGKRVTLVGGPNSDGSFTAYAVFVCSGSQKNVTSQKIQLGQKRSGDFNKANKWSSYLDISTIVLVSLIWLCIVAFFLLKKKKNLVYLLFFTIFYIYIINVLDYTLYQFQSLIVLKHFMPDLMLRGVTAEKSLNLIPLITLTVKDVRTSLQNILLMIPFGFGLPFITNYRMKKIVLIGMFFSIGIEFLQYITGYIGKITFRIADINDVIFNTIGVVIGYLLFVGFVRICFKLFHSSKIGVNPILRHITERTQVVKP